MKPDAIIKKLKLKDQLSAEPSKALVPIEQALVYVAMMTPLLLLAEHFGITDTFKVNVLIGGAIGGAIGSIYNTFSSSAVSQWSVSGEANPDAVHSAMLALKYTEKQPGAYLPKRPLFSLFYRYKAEQITQQTLGGNTVFTGPYDQLKKLSAFPLTDAQTPARSPTSDHMPPTVQG